MDTIFRIKKSRDSGTKSRAQELVSGTLDSIHQTVISDIRETTVNIEELKKRATEIEEELKNLTEIYKATKLEDELRKIRRRLEQNDPLKDYYTKNADIMLEYYGAADRVQAVNSTPADQNTFMKYIVATAPVSDAPTTSKKQLFEEYTSRMKLTTGNENTDQANLS